MNQYEVVLDILNYVKGELFQDGTVTNFGGYSDDASVEITLCNGDKVKLKVEYTKSEVKKDGK